MRTFIRRPGNKSKLIKKILPLIPDFDGTYIEPFVGTGAVFLNLQPKKWIINDINKELIDLYVLNNDKFKYYFRTTTKDEISEELIKFLKDVYK